MPNTDAISIFISSLCEKEPLLVELVELSVGRVLRKSHGDNGHLAAYANEAAILHIIDWLRAAIINDAPWLKRLDEQGRVKKLMKFGRLAQITLEADKAMVKAAQRHTGVLVSGDGEDVVAQLGDGFHIIRLLSPQALDRESAYMQHCIGQGAYDRHLGASNHEFLSLRDGRNKPHVTLEVLDNRVKQLCGKQNRIPPSKYVAKLLPYFQERGLVPSDSGHCGFVVGSDQSWHPLSHMPSGSTFYGPLNARDLGITSIPSNFTIDGSAFLNLSDIQELPDNLTVNGNLMYDCSPIRRLPPDLTVKGDLILDHSAVTELSTSGLHVVGLISLCHSRIEALPDNLQIDGSLHLNGCKISALPSGLIVNGDLSIDSTLVTSLPEDLEVAGMLSLARTKIKSIPSTVVFGGGLDCTGSEIETLPNNLKVKGHLFLSETQIRHLPDNLAVMYSLDLRDTPIKDLPNGLAVGTLRLPPTVKILPDDLAVHTCLDLIEASQIDIPDSISRQCVVKLPEGFLSADDYRKNRREQNPKKIDGMTIFRASRVHLDRF